MIVENESSKPFEDQAAAQAERQIIARLCAQIASLPLPPVEEVQQFLRQRINEIASTRKETESYSYEPRIPPST